METEKIICWWSGGVTSAVACHLSIKVFGIERCRFIFIDTFNEDEDTYRFKNECEKWYGKEIETITGIGLKYTCIQDVWRTHLSLNVATGAKCSQMLKRVVREEWQKENKFLFQVFGFDIDEGKRAKGMALNNPEINPIFLLLAFAMSKKDCVNYILKNNNLFHPLELPRSYKMGYLNNNCFKTKCVQGGIGYWQKVEIEDIIAFDAMADMEHYLTDLKGQPVTMLKDQSKLAKSSGNELVFLKKHPKYPNLKCLADMPKCKVEPLMECNGFCGINDLNPRTETEKQINYADGN